MSHAIKYCCKFDLLDQFYDMDTSSTVRRH